MTILQSALTEHSRRHVMRFQECLDVCEEVGHVEDDRWDYSHRQGGKFLLSRQTGALWDTSHMSEVFDINMLRESLQKAMDRKGIKAKPLAILAGVNETAVRDILKRSENPGVGTLLKIADVLEMSPSDMLGGKVPMLGKIGAGGSILFEELDDPEMVDAPPGSSGRMVALLVQGSSMMPVYRDGDLVYVRRDHDGVLPAYLGEECAVHTADGGTWLKTLSPGTKAGCYTLRSFNADDMENVEVVWASPVLFVQRRRLRRD